MAEIRQRQYTIVLTNYNNTRFIKEALSSIFEQRYNNIQLIITDDASDKFNKKDIEKFIDKHAKNNIKEVTFVINKKNIGTVKTINKALKYATGDYILFFASDDKLADKNVLINFANAFEKTKYNIITSQWKNCDEKLIPKSNCIKYREAKKYNNNLNKQYFRLCQSNIYGSGATSYRKVIFEKYGVFDEKYKYLEDWPFWLRMLDNGEKIYYENFTGLLHRSGGISQSTDSSKAVNKFYSELLNNFKYEIIPNLQKFSTPKQVRIVNSFQYHINNYNQIDTSEYEKYLRNVIISNKRLHFSLIIDKLVPHIIQKIYVLFKYNIVVPLTVIISILIDFIVINNVCTNYKSLIYYYLFCYIIVYLILTAIHEVFSKRK